jgi:peptide-methionine (S)-S-oxide reductase
LVFRPLGADIATFDLPKIANLKAVMPQLSRDKPVLVSQAKD